MDIDSPILIDGITFKLLFKSEADFLGYESMIGGRRIIVNERNIICFTSTTSEGNIIKLFAYTSLSELNVWRLGFINDAQQILKPIDYVQGTLIHHLLQAHFNKHFKTLPIVSDDTCSNRLYVTDVSDDLSPENNELIYTYKEANEEGQKKIMDTHKMIQLPLWEDYLPSKMGRTAAIRGKEEGFRKDRGNLTDDDIDFYTAFEVYPPSFTGMKDGEVRPIMIMPFSNLYSYSHPYQDPSREKLNRISNDIEKIYAIDYDTKTLLTKYSFSNTLNNIKECHVEMYSIDLTHRETPDDNVRLIYNAYTITLLTNNEILEGCYGITLLPSNSPIYVNRYGLYDHFITAGYYIYKPLDYHRQCESQTRMCSTYSYIGDLYNEIFPYSELCPRRLLGGYGSNKHKSNKYKSKKRKSNKYKSKKRKSNK